MPLSKKAKLQRALATRRLPTQRAPTQRSTISLDVSTKKADFYNKFANLENIVARNNKAPTIVNESSNFVVITYWWGRGNKNANTARPCASDFEIFTSAIAKLGRTYLQKSTKSIVKEDLMYPLPDDTEYEKATKAQEFEKRVLSSEANIRIKKIAKRYAEDYHKKVCEYFDCTSKTLAKMVEQKKADGTVNPAYKARSQTEIYDFYYEIGKHMFNYITTTHVQLTDLFQEQTQISNEIDAYYREKIPLSNEIKRVNKELHSLTASTNTSKKALRAELNRLHNLMETLIRKRKSIGDQAQINKSSINEIMGKIKAFFGQPGSSTGISTAIAGESVYQMMHRELRYREPITYEAMAEGWETICRTQGCNYLAIEYPEFAQRGGYQMAINAKPFFIKKALELCTGRNVVYIDTDVYLRIYPKIFDLPNIDFMARGWSVDPRSSWSQQESIEVDPYNFETSGGIMFFAQTEQAISLLDTWAQQSKVFSQDGKADDRILSMVFNARKYLLSMRFIQLPVEYLWLTLNYNPMFMDDFGYPRKYVENRIYIEHPECLTSEETASDKGASSDRTPKYYSFLTNHVVISELLREKLFYPDDTYTSCLRTYLDDLKKMHYYDDGNPQLYERGLVTKGNDPEDNEQPFYVVDYKDGMGNYPYFGDTSLTYNDVYSTNMTGSSSADIKTTFETKYKVEHTNPKLVHITVSTDKEKNTIINDPAFIQYCMAMLRDGVSVHYNPTMSTKAQMFMQAIHEKQHVYNKLDFAYAYEAGIDEYISDYFRSRINFDLPFILNPGTMTGTTVTNEFLGCNRTFADLSEMLGTGAYQFLSLMRVGYLTGSHKTTEYSRMTIRSPKSLLPGGSKSRKRVPRFI